MPQFRLWEQSDLPRLAEMAAITAWNITPEDDKPYTSQEHVSASAVQNLYGVLGSPGGTAVVADEGGKPVGYLLIAIQHNDMTGEPMGYMADIYVEPAFRRGGVSKELHRVGEEYLRRLGVRKATNWTHAHNQLGQSATAYHGFRPWGVMMVKELQAASGAPVQVTAASRAT